MLFNSHLFIFIFLPLTLLGWYGLNRWAGKWATAFLVGMSLWFYGYFNPYYLLIIVVSILGNYLLSFLLQFAKTKGMRRLGLIGGLGFNLGLLFYYKYYDFFIENVNAIFSLDFNLKHILLPLGISFFTFQQLSFIIDRCKGKAAHYSLVDYAVFVTFFPQLIAGPIVLHEEMLPQFADIHNRKFNPEHFSRGIALFVLGLAKKVLLADNLARLANFGYGEQVYYLDTLSALLVVLAYTFEIYFDFSGYCDMAVGLGKMFNIKLPINFNSPFKAVSPRELWQRWHITLSRFFTTYVYIPLGGSRKGKIRRALNLVVVFFLSGLWHGAGWTYVAWGTMQGLLVAWDSLGITGVKRAREDREDNIRHRHSKEENIRYDNGKNNENKADKGGKTARIYLPRWLGWFITFSFFNLSVIFFRSLDIPRALQMWKNLFVFKNTGFIFQLAAQMDIPEFYVARQVIEMLAPQLLNYALLAVMLLLLLISAIVLTKRNAVEIVENTTFSSRFCWGITILFVWSVISFSQVSTFIYFNF